MMWKMGGNKKRDERQHWLLTESLAVAAFVAYFYGLFLFVLKLIKTKDFNSVLVEFGLLMVMAVAMFLHRMFSRSYDIPTTIGGKVLPTGKSKEDKKKRLFHYIKNAFTYSVLATIFHEAWRGNKGFLIQIGNSYWGIIIDGIVKFIMFLIINYLWGEHNVNRYNKYCDSLEQD